jgi:hypothetical protein
MAADKFRDCSDSTIKRRIWDAKDLFILSVRIHCVLQLAGRHFTNPRYVNLRLVQYSDHVPMALERGNG